MVILAPSILGYEGQLETSLSKIKEMVDAGVEWLHIDVMRPPFTPGKKAFSKEALLRLYKEFKGKVKFDFHLMCSYPQGIIDFINAMVDEKDRKDVSITVHREAFRSGFGRYDSKEFDLLNMDTGDKKLDKELKKANEASGKKILDLLRGLKAKRYKVGIALEPGTSLKNVPTEMLGVANMVLLMGVSSGAGGQNMRGTVLNKVMQLRKRFGGMIQVDGGVNDKTIVSAIGAGANNVVIGSHITSSDDVKGKVSEVKGMIG